LVLYVGRLLFKAFDDLSKREMVFEARNDESWHDESIYEVGKR